MPSRTGWRRGVDRSPRTGAAGSAGLEQLVERVGEVLWIGAPAAVGPREQGYRDADVLGEGMGRPARGLLPGLSPAALTSFVDNPLSVSMSGVYPPICRSSWATKRSKFPVIRSVMSGGPIASRSACAISSLCLGPQASMSKARAGSESGSLGDERSESPAPCWSNSVSRETAVKRLQKCLSVGSSQATSSW